MTKEKLERANEVKSMLDFINQYLYAEEGEYYIYPGEFTTTCRRMGVLKKVTEALLEKRNALEEEFEKL